MLVVKHMLIADNQKLNGPSVMNGNDGTICFHMKEPKFSVSDVVTMHHYIRRELFMIKTR